MLPLCCWDTPGADTTLWAAAPPWGGVYVWGGVGTAGPAPAAGADINLVIHDGWLQSAPSSRCHNSPCPPPPPVIGAINERQHRHSADPAMSSLDAIREGYARFDPHAYLQNNYVPPRADFSSEECVVPWKLRCLAETFASGEICGRTLIDVGSGPTIYQLLSACEHFEEIVATDFLEVNREELRRWVRGEPGAFDWSPFIQHVCKIEGRGEPWQEKEQRLRGRLRRILPIDVHRADPLGAPLHPPADALLSTFCLEAVSPDRAAFGRALVNVGSMLRPGGHALLLGALGESFYLAGAARLPVVPLDEDDVRGALSDAGFTLRDFRSYAMPPALRTGVDDVDGVFFVHAQKPLEG
ncbi:phenylethanolamine N-methyltransferase [Phasianus colchicus]|uniref:phenylethanolamine N-methyltransferase n=1 Tax=Phasianus colchicus TaxID=9054 RepID=UPI00129D9175|nr:phenylethanolamine N-methyltransferase [Phasianus colchicus]